MKRASLSATPKWRPSTSKATPCIPSGITPSSPVPAKHQVEALISRSLLSDVRCDRMNGSHGACDPCLPCGERRKRGFQPAASRLCGLGPPKLRPPRGGGRWSPKEKSGSRLAKRWQRGTHMNLPPKKRGQTVNADLVRTDPKQADERRKALKAIGKFGPIRRR